MEELFQAINTYGFPIVVAVYLLVSAERQRRDLKKEREKDSERWEQIIVLLAGDPLNGKDGLLQKIDKLIQHLNKKRH